MNTLVEQIKNLSFNKDEIDNGFDLIGALNEYHEMIRDGKLKPRGNTLGTLQENIMLYNTLRSNISRV